MSTPPYPNTTWTVETALDHLLAVIELNNKRYEQRFGDIQRMLELSITAQKEAGNIALTAQKESVIKAESAAEKRFESVNEFRNTLSDQQRTLIPREEVSVIAKGLTDKLTSLEKALDALIEERKGIQGGWGYAAGVAGFVFILVSLVMFAFKLLK